MFAVFMLTQFSVYYAAQRVRDRLVDNEVNCMALNKPTQLNEFARNFIQSFFCRKWNEDVTRVTYMLRWAVMIYSFRGMALFAASRRLFFSTNVLSTCCCCSWVIHRCHRRDSCVVEFICFAGRTETLGAVFYVYNGLQIDGIPTVPEHLSVFFQYFIFILTFQTAFMGTTLNTWKCLFERENDA